ncbi:MAG: MgtC/SapB family protein [Megasphaera massiliensis]|uniref:MgtC/SapB family protein n=1 Tax=Megasphaera massiliensis TaxID=1232428 RepID=UPI002108F1CA|nr:MgtC/SapB family protein [Megasphaera massiliensis]MCQ5210040.1 MgtC/SapB family protein [Megasphaera massiliensis]MEE0659299.1 MgtC/SapB family protein [Megasphaera massiliensis]
MISTEDSIIRLVISLILGAIIGYERQSQSKSAGLRTHTLVCVGSCLCMIISINVAMEYFFEFGYRNADPGRIAAQVVSGVGFIGAGTILANQKERSVRGLTTAAGIWAVSAIGLVVGAGYLVVAIVATALIFLVLTVFVRLDARLEGQFRKKYIMHVVMKNNIDQARRLSHFVSDHQLHIKKFHNYSDDEAPLSEIELELTALSHVDAPEIISELLAVKGIKEADFYADDGQKKALVGP